MGPASPSTDRATLATVLVLLAGALAAALVVLRSVPPAGAPRRPTDDAEVLERVVPRAAARDAGAAPQGSAPPSAASGDVADAGEASR